MSYDLITVGGIVTPQQTILYEVPIKDREGKIEIIKAYEIDEICQELACIDKKVTKLFKGVKLKHIERTRKKVQLLIGMDYINLHPVRLECNRNLGLFSSLFGTGKLLGVRHKYIKSADEMSPFAKTVAYGTRRNVRVMKPENYVDFLTLEDTPVRIPARCTSCINCPKCKFEVNQLSKCEQKELEVIRSNLKLDPIKNVCTTEYPYKMDPTMLKDN